MSLRTRWFVPALVGTWALAIVSGACARQVIIQREIVYVERAAPGADGSDPARPPAAPREQVSDERTAPGPPAAGLEGVLTAAREHVGRNAVRVNGISYRYDCSGFVRGAFSVIGVDVMALGSEFPNVNGVTLIFRYVERFGENHLRKVPNAGDVVYFDNTWDQNTNGRLDDPLTHVGLVDEVKPDGTFFVIHRTHRGIVRDPMNVLRPGDRTDAEGNPINAWLRPKTRRDPPGAAHLMGELFAGFGSVRGPIGDVGQLLLQDLPAAAEGAQGALPGDAPGPFARLLP